MSKSIFVTLFLSSIASANLPECHPDYQEWITVGAPASWCYPRQCRGDTNNAAEGSSFAGYRYVYLEDLAFVLDLWGKKSALTLDELAADFDHRRSGSPYNGYHRVGTNDCCILYEYFGILEPPRGSGVPECNYTCPIENCVIDGPQLSFQVRLPNMGFISSDLITIPNGTTIDIGIVNNSTDKCTCYDGYVSITSGLAFGEWSGTEWVYNSSVLQWTYFGTATVPGMDTWYVEASPTDTNDPTVGSVSASVTLRYNGPGKVKITLLNEFFEEVDELVVQSGTPSPIILTSPNGGEVLMSGRPLDIAWVDNGTIRSVDIEYSADGGHLWNAVANGIPNTGQYTWECPFGINTNECVIRLGDSSYPEVSDSSDAFFTVFSCTLSPNIGDLNNDCYVNLADFALFCESWLVCGNPLDDFCTGD